MPQTDKSEKVEEMHTSSNVVLVPKNIAPPLFASPWLALFSAFKNGWQRAPMKAPTSKTP